MSSSREDLDSTVELYLAGAEVTDARNVSDPPITTYLFYKELKERGIPLRGRLSRREVVDDNTILRCKNCGKQKGTICFSKHEGTRSGYDISRCKSCKRSKVSWENVPIERRMLNRAKGAAKRKGVPFDLEITDIVLPDVCPVFGKPFIYGDHMWTYSIDRLVPGRGYTKGNIQIISNKANMMKGVGNSEDIYKLYVWLKEMEENCMVDF